MTIYATNDTPTTADYNRVSQGALSSDTVASAASVVIADEYFYTITGTTQIDNFSPTADRVGDQIRVLFQSQLTLNPLDTGNIKFPGTFESRGFVTLPNTICEFIRVGTDWHMVSTNRNTLLPHWRVTMSSTQNVSDGSNDVIEFDTVNTSNYTSAFDTSNFRLDIPHTGIYSVYCQQRVNGTAGSGNFETKIRRNGTTIGEDRDALSINVVGGSVNIPVFSFTAGAQIDVTSDNNSGNTYTIQDANSQTYFMIRMLEVM